MTNRDIGYEIGVKIPRQRELQFFCVDSDSLIRGTYQNKAYMQDHELWHPWEGLGTMYGEFKVGGLVSALDLNGKPLLWNKKEITNLVVKEIEKVSISAVEISDTERIRRAIE